MNKFVPRVCQYCNKPFETTAYSYFEHGERKRGFFHSGCFRKFKVTLS